MKKLEELQKRFQNKQINRMVSFRKECPLTFSEKTVFSYMFFRMRKKGNVAPASVRKLSKVSGMHRDTIAKALRRLETYGLVRCRDGKWRLTTEGVRNHSDWFGFRGKGRNHEDLAYHYFPQPTKESPITIIDCLVMVSDQFQPKLRSALLAARFGVSWATIDRSRKKLRNAEFQLDWIRDIEPLQTEVYGSVW
jgi:Mn-dependent DtxR family transcriptional regulator